MGISGTGPRSGLWWQRSQCRSLHLGLMWRMEQERCSTRSLLNTHTHTLCLRTCTHARTYTRKTHTHTPVLWSYTSALLNGSEWQGGASVVRRWHGIWHTAKGEAPRPQHEFPVIRQPRARMQGHRGERVTCLGWVRGTSDINSQLMLPPAAHPAVGLVVVAAHIVLQGWAGHDERRSSRIPGRASSCRAALLTVRQAACIALKRCSLRMPAPSLAAPSLGMPRKPCSKQGAPSTGEPIRFIAKSHLHVHWHASTHACIHAHTRAQHKHTFSFFLWAAGWLAPRGVHCC